MGDKTALGQIFSEYFGFFCQSFIHLLHIHHHPSSGTDAIGQMLADVLSRVKSHPTQKKLLPAETPTESEIERGRERGQITEGRSERYKFPESGSHDFLCTTLDYNCHNSGYYPSLYPDASNTSRY
jgi:hypothetical protein